MNDRRQGISYIVIAVFLTHYIRGKSHKNVLIKEQDDDTNQENSVDLLLRKAECDPPMVLPLFSEAPGACNVKVGLEVPISFSVQL